MLYPWLIDTNHKVQLKPLRSVSTKPYKNQTSEPMPYKGQLNKNLVGAGGGAGGKND